MPLYPLQSEQNITGTGNPDIIAPQNGVQLARTPHDRLIRRDTPPLTPTLSYASPHPDSFQTSYFNISRIDSIDNDSSPSTPSPLRTGRSPPQDYPPAETHRLAYYGLAGTFDAPRSAIDTRSEPQHSRRPNIIYALLNDCPPSRVNPHAPDFVEKPEDESVTTASDNVRLSIPSPVEATQPPIRGADSEKPFALGEGEDGESEGEGCEDPYREFYFEDPNQRAILEASRATVEGKKLHWEYYPYVYHQKQFDALGAETLAQRESVGLNTLPDGVSAASGQPATRPPYTLATLFKLAILGSPHQQLTIEEIRWALMARFPYYALNGEWKKSMRHELTMKKKKGEFCMKNVPEGDPSSKYHRKWWGVVDSSLSSALLTRRRGRPPGSKNGSSPARKDGKRKRAKPLNTKQHTVTLPGIKSLNLPGVDFVMPAMPSILPPIQDPPWMMPQPTPPHLRIDNGSAGTRLPPIMPLPSERPSFRESPHLWRDERLGPSWQTNPSAQPQYWTDTVGSSTLRGQRPNPLPSQATDTCYASSWSSRLNLSPNLGTTGEQRAEVDARDKGKGKARARPGDVYEASDSYRWHRGC